MTIKFIEEVKHCPECMSREDDLTVDTIYECENCGNKFAKETEGTHRCPDCGKFATKLTDEGCQECCEELVEDEAWECGACQRLHSTATEAYECCSAAAGEPEPDEVKAEKAQKEAARLARERQETEKLEELMAKFPPKYRVGDVIENIDLGARGSFNRQAFVNAEVLELKPRMTNYGQDVKFWQYVLARLPDKDRKEYLTEQDIEYQTGKHSDHEYRWCCPGSIVHPGESCPTCGKKFEDIYQRRRCWHAEDIFLDSQRRQRPEAQASLEQ